MTKMAALILTSLLALTGSAIPLQPRTGATCNIDMNPMQTADAYRACNAIPAQITGTGTTTLLAQSPTNPQVGLFLNQRIVN